MTDPIPDFVREHVKASRERRRVLATFGSNAAGVVAATDFGLFIVDPEDGYVAKDLLVRGRYEQELYDLLKTHVTRDGDVLVVGAHVGTHVVPLSRRCRNLHAFEANPLTAGYLKANVSLNDCRNVSIHCVAANDKAEKLEFLLNRENSGSSKRMPVSMQAMYVYDEPGVTEVDAVRLDDHLGERFFDLVLMDVEGSEVPALRGMQEILKNTKVLCVEFMPDHLTYVAGATTDDLVDAVEPHFGWMTVVGSNVLIPMTEVREELRAMHAADRGCDLFFHKVV